MKEEDKHFVKRYEELLDKGYCDCNEMNCIDNNSPRRILKIVKELDNINEKLSLALESAEKKLDQKEFIIKEVREYINKIPTQPVIRVFKKELLEILDKVDKDV